LTLNIIIYGLGLLGYGGVAPVKEASVVRASRHANAAPYAAFLVNKYCPFRASEGSSYRTDVHAGGILAMLAWNRYELRTTSMEFMFKELYPLHRFGGIMSLDTGLGTLRR
jgi:hypothetical protein